MQVSEDDEPDTDSEHFPEIFTDVENEQSVLKPSRYAAADHKTDQFPCCYFLFLMRINAFEKLTGRINRK